MSTILGGATYRQKRDVAVECVNKFNVTLMNFLSTKSDKKNNNEQTNWLFSHSPQHQFLTAKIFHQNVIDYKLLWQTCRISFLSGLLTAVHLSIMSVNWLDTYTPATTHARICSMKYKNEYGAKEKHPFLCVRNIYLCIYLF